MEKSQLSYGSYPSEPHSKLGQPSKLPGYVPSEPVYTPPKYGWCEDTQRNKPQSNTLAAATFIFASGGMSLAWSIGFAPYMGRMPEMTRTHLQICWFVAVILGAITAAFLADNLKKRTFNLIASVLVLINGILYISAPKSVAAVTIARYCDGIAFGLTIIPAIMAGSEQSVKRFRGLVLSIESIGLTLGITFKTIYNCFWENDWDFNTNQMHGALALVYGAVALLCTFCLTIESPTFYLRRDQEPEALNCLRKLQNPREITTETYALLYENKHLLEEDVTRGQAENLALGVVPMAKLCIFRVLVSMSLSLPLTWGYITAATIVDNTDTYWPIYFYGTMRMMGTVFAIFSLDSFGRRVPTGVAMLIGGGLLIGVGSVFSSNYLYSSGQMEAVMGLIMVYQLLAGLVAPASTTYLGEAFSISVKPYFILVAVFCENIVQIIIGCAFRSTSDSFSSFVMVLGSLQIVFGVAIFIGMPETKQTTLREALAKFKKILYISFR